MAIDVRIHFVGQCLWVSHKNELTVLMPASTGAHAHDPHVTRVHAGPPVGASITRWPALSDVSQGSFAFAGQASSLGLPSDIPDLGSLMGGINPVTVKSALVHAPAPAAGLSCRIHLKGGRVSGLLSHDYSVRGMATRIAGHVIWDGTAVLGAPADLPATAEPGSITVLPEFPTEKTGTVVEFTVMHIPLSHVTDPRTIPSKAPVARTRIPHAEALYSMFDAGALPVPEIWFEGPLGAPSLLSVDPFLCVGGGGGE